MTDHKCGNCAHWGDGKAFSAYGMDFCCREDSGHYNDLMNSDSYCNSRERWKAMLTKWMEGLDADRP